MTSEFLFGMIIGIVLMALCFLLFRDIFIRHIFSHAVPVVKDLENGQFKDLEEFKDKVLEDVTNDIITSYKLLILIGAVINYILMDINTLDPEIRRILLIRIKEIKRAVQVYEEFLKVRNLNISDFLNEHELEDLDRIKKMLK